MKNVQTQDLLSLEETCICTFFAFWKQPSEDADRIGIMPHKFSDPVIRW